MLLRWFKSHRAASCRGLFDGRLQCRSAVSVPVDWFASAGDIFNWPKCLHTQALLLCVAFRQKCWTTVVVQGQSNALRTALCYH